MRRPSAPVPVAGRGINNLFRVGRPSWRRHSRRSRWQRGPRREWDVGRAGLARPGIHAYPEEALNRAERERAQWLSEDLYSVSEPHDATLQKELNPHAQQQLNEAFEARRDGDWDRALALLRRWREYISPALLSYLRGSIWLEAGSPNVAAVFYRHATESDPENANYRAIYMHALDESDPVAASRLAKEVLADDEKHAPVVVSRAANTRFLGTRADSNAEAARVYRELIPILERNMARIERDESTASRASAYAMTAGLLGICYEFLGNAGAAVRYYSLGLQAKPDDDALLVARGILFYGSSPRAITDLERAARLGSPVIWPYLFLAHHYLATDRFDQCRAMCEMGLMLPGSDAAKSQLEEWRAIAQAERGFSPELVRTAFEAAVRLDPSNDRARLNQAAFEAALRVPRSAAHSRWEQQSALAVRQFGLAERRYAMAA